MGTTVCDFGSGVGYLSIQLARTHPHLMITLQDVPDTIELSKKVPY
jgi:16S rRNA G1207 methylase RsmC